MNMTYYSFRDWLPKLYDFEGMSRVNEELAWLQAAGSAAGAAWLARRPSAPKARSAFNNYPFSHGIQRYPQQECQSRYELQDKVRKPLGYKQVYQWEWPYQSSAPAVIFLHPSMTS